MKFNLSNFRKKTFHNQSALVYALWLVFELFFFKSSFPFSGIKSIILISFGARVGKGLVIKQHVRIKLPWKLTIGDNVWIGESAWIDNIESVSIGSNSCISQGVYFCTGSHDWKSENFDLDAKPIHVGYQCWVGAMSILGPGVSIGNGSIVQMGSVVSKSILDNSIVKVNGSIEKIVYD